MHERFATRQINRNILINRQPGQITIHVKLSANCVTHSPSNILLTKGERPNGYVLSAKQTDVMTHEITRINGWDPAVDELHESQTHSFRLVRLPNLSVLTFRFIC